MQRLWDDYECERGGDVVRGSLVRRARHWIANRGWRGFLGEVVRRVELWLRGQRRVEVEAAAREKVHPFDEQYGVETGGLVWGERLGSGQGAEYWATGYYGISPSVFWRAMDRLGVEWAGYTFVDVGCGKGRALMLALRYSFRRVLGVELSAELAGAARENLRRFSAEWRRDEVPWEVVAGNATKLELPEGPLVLFLYHPFAAPVMREFLAHLKSSLRREPRETYLLYVNPELGELLRGQLFLEQLWDEFLPLEEEDVAADRFGSRHERVAAYRVR